MFFIEEYIDEFGHKDKSVLDSYTSAVNKFEKDIESASSVVNIIDKAISQNVPVYKKFYSDKKEKIDWQKNIKEYATIYLVMPSSLYKLSNINIDKHAMNNISNELRGKTIKTSAMLPRQFKLYFVEIIGDCKALNTPITYFTTYNAIIKNMQQMKTSVDKLLAEYKDRLKVFKSDLAKWQKIEDQINKGGSEEISIQGTKISIQDASLYLKNLSALTKEYLSDLSYAYTYMIKLIQYQQKSWDKKLSNNLDSESLNKIVLK